MTTLRHTALSAEYGSPELLDAVEELLALTTSEEVGLVLQQRNCDETRYRMNHKPGTEPAELDATTRKNVLYRGYVPEYGKAYLGWRRKPLVVEDKEKACNL